MTEQEATDYEESLNNDDCVKCEFEKGVQVKLQMEKVIENFSQKIQQFKYRFSIRCIGKWNKRMNNEAMTLKKCLESCNNYFSLTH